MFAIVTRKRLVPGIVSIKVRAPDIARVHRPGQFIILRIDEMGERIPLTVADKDPERGTVTLIFQEVGRTTYQLARMAVGSALLDLAGPLGHCVECHSSPGANGAPDMENALGAGGFVLYGPWGVSVSANITPSGIGGKSDAEIRQEITTGMRANGTRLMPPMAFSYYANLTSEDLDAIVAYLRTLPPK